MFPLAETREICTRLLRASLLQLQEIPKSADRNVIRTIFLYYIDIERAYGWLLDRWYHSLENVARRRVMQDAVAWTVANRVESAQTHVSSVPAPVRGSGGASNGNDWRQDVESTANNTTTLARGLLRDSELHVWQRLQNDRIMLTVAESRLLRDTFVLSHLPG